MNRILPKLILQKFLYNLFALLLVFFCCGMFGANVFGQNLVINEFCSLNTSVFDDDNDTPDWIEIYNPTSSSINLGDYYLSDDDENFKKWNFPAMQLEPNAYLMVFASGKDRKEQNYLTNLINMGDTFAYVIGSENIPVDWKQPSFSANDWEMGASGFGYGDEDDETFIEEGTLSVFVRRNFEIEDVNQLNKIYFHVDYDDGFVAYINGKEIARANLGTPGTEVNYDQEADSYVEPVIINGIAPELFEINDVANFLVNGDNVLAIQIHNNSSNSSDLTLIPFLSVESESPVAGRPMPSILGMSSRSLHTNFKITADGENILLCNSSEKIIDQTDSIVLPSGVSYGRSVDDNSWLYYSEPTPGTSNITNGYRFLGNSIVSFAPVGGKYGTSKQVRLSSYAGGIIYYTTDGSVPNETSDVYREAIDIDETTVIKAIVYSDDVLPVSPSVETYILESRAFDLPVISISSDPDNFFDWNKGILVEGPNAQGSFPYFGANFWQDWERPIYIEYYDEAGVKKFESPGGTKVFGGWSRGMNQKSLSLFARKAYGAKSFDYKFFEERANDKFKSLVLRNSGNDSDRSHIRDGIMTGLVHNVDIDRQAFQPTIIYINGEYWGVLNLREKINEDFLEQNHDGVDADEVDILERDGWAVVEGSSDHYRDMISYIEQNGLVDQDDYDYVAGLMDVDNFMDYQIAQIYYDNQDWPGNNIKFWRPQRENGKWRWILYDTDFGFGIGFGAWGSGYQINTLEFALYADGGGWPNPDWSTFLLRSFVENDKFVQSFSNRFADRLNHDFSSDNVTDFIYSIEHKVSDEVPYHSIRWDNLWGFDDEVSYFYEFAEERPYYMRQHITEQFSLGRIVNLEVDVNDVKQGKVQVNTLSLENFPWKGKYFKDNAVPVAAIPEPGYAFSHWEGIESSSSFLSLNIPSEGIKLKAIFKKADRLYNSVVINEIKYKSSDTKNSGDWVELFNTTEVALDVTGWKLSDSDIVNAFVFPKGSVIPPKGYMVVCEDLNDFAEQNPLINNVVGNIGFGFNASFELLWLINNKGVTVDSLNYFDESPWPTITDDQTISLYTPYSDNELGVNWLSSQTEGTPGENNDNFTDIEDEHIEVDNALMTIYPNPVVDYTILDIENERVQDLSVELYDLKGSYISNLFTGKLNAGVHELMLNVDRDIPAGLYIINVNLEQGVSQSLKLVKM